MNLLLPTDWLLNLGSIPRDAGLVAAAPTVVVLQHGLIRTHASLGRLARCLLAHGYEVFNPSYPSTRAPIEAHAARLAESLDRWLSARAQRLGGADPTLAFCGHSMGGLVIRAYLARADARPAASCLFVATPQRGAALAKVRVAHSAIRRFFGGKALAQLVPGDPFYDRLPALVGPRIGVIAGARGTKDGWNPLVPGDDDGTVALTETALPWPHERVVLRVGHTRITTLPATLLQALHFLRHGRFRPTS
jgi:pimeloyl-ACP methyl ester carboxylesterase